MKKTNNIFIDGSYNYQTKEAGIGIYDDLFEKEMYFKINNLESPYESEEEALKYALIYVSKNLNLNLFRIFTDSEQLYNNYKNKIEKIDNCLNMIWIPRSINIKADELSKLGRVTKDKNLIKNKIDFQKKKIIEKREIIPLERNQYALFIRNNYSYEQKKRLILKLHNKSDKDEVKIVKMALENKSLRKKNIEKNVFLLFIYAILNKNERKSVFNHLILAKKISSIPNNQNMIKILKRF